MMVNGLLKLICVGALGLLVSFPVHAQYTIQHQQPTVLNRSSTNTIEFFVPGIADTDVLDALLFYRNEGDLGYSQLQAGYNNGVFRVQVGPNELTGNSFQYYFQLSVRNLDQDVFFPENLAAENPVEVQIVDEPTQPELPRAEGIDYTILSPQERSGVTRGNAYIAVSLFYNPESIPAGEFKLLIDGVDVTSEADTSNFFISYVPKNLSRGNHKVQILYQTELELLQVAAWEFKLVDTGKAQYGGLKPRFFPTGRVELTARNQVIAGDPNNAFTGRSNLSGSYGLFRYSINGFFTSQESSRLQPQNRYGIEMQLGKWLHVEAGHVYPMLSRFTISGRRMFGVNSLVHVLKDKFHIQFMYGELERKITNRYAAVVVDTVFAGGLPQDTTYTLSYRDSGRGTFARKIIAGRLGIGDPRTVQFGVQAMKIQDDSTSIFNVTDYNDLLNGPQALYANLTPQDRLNLQDNPDLLQIGGGSPRPKGNFVAGADLSMNLYSNKVRFKTEAVASALNNDIYGGPLDSLRAADIGFEDLSQDDLDILERLSRFIIINENMSVLPFRLRNVNTDSSDAEVFFPTSILGSHTELSLVYPKNSFTAQYRWVGPDFSSLANSTIRRDIAGFTFSDRFRMLQNQLFLTLGFEALNDNVTNTREATTNTLSYRTNVSWYPVKEILPKVSLGIRYRTRNNSVDRFNPIVPAQLENAAVLNIRFADGDTLTTTSPRQNNTLNLSLSITQKIRLFDMVHDATVSLSSLRTRDEVFAYGDAKNISVSLNVATRFEQLPLTTQYGMNFNSTKAGSGQLDIDIFGMYVGGTYFMLNDRLILNGRLAFTSNVSKTRMLEVVNGEDEEYLNDYYELSADDNRSRFATLVLLGGAEYRLDQNHSFVFDSNFTNVTGRNSLNDRIVQLSYVYRF